MKPNEMIDAIGRWCQVHSYQLMLDAASKIDAIRFTYNGKVKHSFATINEAYSWVSGRA